MTTTAPNHRDTLLSDMFAALDRGDIDGYLEYLAPGASLRFANNPAVVGRQANKESLQRFYEVFKWCRHAPCQPWPPTKGPGGEADVSYERTDGREVHVPAVTICRFDEHDLVDDYRIFVDLAPLFAVGPSVTP